MTKSYPKIKNTILREIRDRKRIITKEAIMMEVSKYYPEKYLHGRPLTEDIYVPKHKEYLEEYFTRLYNLAMKSIPQKFIEEETMINRGEGQTKL